VDVRREIEELVAFEGRIAGWDAERRAAEHLAGRLRKLGRDAQIEPTAVRPNWALTHLIHALLAIAGSLVAVTSPPIGALIAAFAALSTLGDLTGTLFLVRRLTGRRASQNVLSREEGGKPGVVVLVAHYDAARGGSIFGPRVAERRAALAKRLRLPLGLGGGFVLAVLVIVVCAVLRVLGLDSLLVSVVQFVPTALLILALPLLADLQLSAPSPGAADNASGVATALRLAESRGSGLRHADLWLLFTGAEEPMALGMREWLRRHSDELGRDRTVFLNLDMVANGTVRYVAREGPVLASSADRDLVAICEEIASGDGDDGRFGARPLVARTTSDALAARARGYRAITISCRGALDQQPNQHQPTDTPDRVDTGALERAFAFASAVIRRVDIDMERLDAEAGHARESTS
jgi:Peptidase family M28